VLEQDVERHRQEHEERPVQQVGDDAHADESRARDDVPGGGCRVPCDVHLGVHNPLCKAAEDANEQVEDAGDPRETLGG
jgi:hypothetical protein